MDFLGNEREKAAADVIVFEYRLTMPGKIASAQPANAEIDGGTATWKLKASDLQPDDAEYIVEATSTMVRWDVVMLLGYVGGYLLYRLIALLVRRARLRPRKI